ncbi:MAG: prepilin peptidase [Victivallales bacterium]|nr:prepilin peptidase [Victivallales bacterium]
MEIRLLFGIFAFCMGAIVGSFLNVVVWRVPRGMSLLRPPSTCPQCGHRIRPWENIPILSWLFLRGKCSSCRQPISWKYPAGEVAVGLLYWAVYWRVVNDGMLPLSTILGWWWFAGAVLSLARIDYEKGVIPNLVTYSGAIAAVILAVVFPYGRPAIAKPKDLNLGSVLSRPVVSCLSGVGQPAVGIRLAAVADALLGILLAVALLGSAYWLGRAMLQAWRKRHRDSDAPREPLGWGDIKMLAMAGAFLGADACVYLLAGGALVGFVVGVVLLARRKKSAGVWSSMPFAPFFAVPALLWVVYGNWFYLLFELFTPQPF